MFDERDRRKIYSVDLSSSSNYDKIKTFLDVKEATDLFKRKVKIIKKHLQN